MWRAAVQQVMQRCEAASYPPHAYAQANVQLGDAPPIALTLLPGAPHQLPVQTPYDGMNLDEFLAATPQRMPPVRRMMWQLHQHNMHAPRRKGHLFDVDQIVQADRREQVACIVCDVSKKKDHWERLCSKVCPHAARGRYEASWARALRSLKLAVDKLRQPAPD